MVSREADSSRRSTDAALYVGVLLPLCAFAVLAAAAATGEGWDADILRFSHHYYRQSIAGPLEETLKISMGVGAAIGVVAVVVLLAKKRRLHALFWVLAVGGVLILDLPLKEIFRRPFLDPHGGGYTFPSGNAMDSVAIVAAIALTIPARWRRVAIAAGVLFVIGYGAVLVYQWWHYPSDIVAGWCVALSWASGLWLALGHWQRTRGASHDDGRLSRAGQVGSGRGVSRAPDSPAGVTSAQADQLGDRSVERIAARRRRDLPNGASPNPLSDRRAHGA
jgi:undecaprenyl-diphosphatase